MAQVVLYSEDAEVLARKGMHAPKRPGDLTAWFKDACKVLHRELGCGRLAKPGDRPHFKEHIAGLGKIVFRLEDGRVIEIDRKAQALAT